MSSEGDWSNAVAERRVLGGGQMFGIGGLDDEKGWSSVKAAVA